MGAPVVTPLTRYVLLNQSVLASTLFTASDPDNDPITQFRFADQSNVGGTGFFRFNGVPRPQGATTTVSAADLSKLSFVSGSLIGNENIRIEVFANGEWSAAVLAPFYFVRDNITPPIVTVSNPNVLQDEAISLASFISAADPDGWPIQKFYLRDTKTGSTSGALRLNGVELTQGVYHTVQAADFAGLDYFARSYTENERIEVFAWDGTMWSTYKFSTPVVQRNVNVPTTFFADVAVASLSSSAIVQALGWNDPDGNTIKTVQLMDTTATPGSGNLEQFGSVLAPNVWHPVSAANLDSMRFVGANTNMTDTVKYRVWDGRFWSNISDLRVRTVVRPELANDFVHQTSLWNVPYTEFVTKLDVGPAIQKYEVIDLTTSSITGNLRRGTTTLAPGQVHTFTSSQLGTLNFRTGRPDQRSYDEVLVRAFNGTFWSAWSRVEFRTEPVYRHATKFLDNPNNLMSMESNTWGDWLPLVGADPKLLSYSFMGEFPEYSSGDATVDTFSTFTFQQRQLAREAFRQMSEVCEIRFEEIADQSINEFGQVGGIIRMGNYFLAPDPPTAAYATPPGLDPNSGDIWINLFFNNPSISSPGTGEFATFIHELGHAVGMKHPFDDPPTPNDGPFLPTATDNDNFTVMSYTRRPDGQSPFSYMLYDMKVLQDFYGANMETRTGDDLYDISGFMNGNDQYVGVIWDAGGDDTISVQGAQRGCVVDLRQGGFSSYGRFFDFFTSQFVNMDDQLGVAFEVDIENGVGSGFGDTITGNALANTLTAGGGNDEIWGAGGADMLRGNAGDDTYTYRLGDGNDVIDEQAGGGRDRIELGSFPTLDSFTSDLSFRKLGRDLIVELALDGGLPESTITVFNQSFGGYRVETMQFNGVDVDLNSVFAQSTSVSKRFSISASSSTFGFLVTPV